jgi:hypothetical protein
MDAMELDQVTAVTLDTAHVATSADSAEANEHSVVMLLKAAGTSNDTASETEAATIDTAHVATPADSAEAYERSVVRLLKAAGTSNNTANEHSVLMLLQAGGASHHMASAKSTARLDSSSSKNSSNNAPATTTESETVPQPTQATNNSNSTSKETLTTVVAATTEIATEQEGPLSTNNYNYKVCYDVELQNTIDGYMLFLGGNEYKKPFVFNYKVCFEYYKKHKGDVVAQVEKDMVMKNKHDVLLAVNGQDVSGKDLHEVLDIITRYKTNPGTCQNKLKLTSLDRSSFNAFYSITSVFKG